MLQFRLANRLSKRIDRPRAHGRLVGSWLGVTDTQHRFDRPNQVEGLEWLGEH